MRLNARYSLPISMGLALPLFVVLEQGSGLDPMLSTHEARLQEAKSLTAKFTVQRLPAAPVEYTLAYSKDGSMKVDGPDKLILLDGKTATVLDKAKNTYTQEPMDEKTLLAKSGDDSVFSWAAFFGKDRLKDAKGSKPGAKRGIKGNLVTEFTFSRNEGKQIVTLYLDQKLGIARGASIKNGNDEMLVIASDLVLSDKPLDPSVFAFTPPEGATKAEPAADLITYAQVAPIFKARCISCHSAGSPAGGLDLSSYAGVRGGGRAVVPGNSRASGVVRSMRSGTMPKSGARVPDDEIDLIAKWIDQGAKE
jgi:outer membrane lipoprotein-sorting protein